MKRQISILLSAMMGFATVMSGIGTNSVQAAETVSLQEGSYIEGEALVLIKKGLPSTKAKAAAAMNLGEGLQIEDLWNFDSKSSEESQRSKTAKAQNLEDDFSIALVKSETLSTEDLIESLSDNPEIKAAEPNYKIEAADALSNDTYGDFQWGMKNTGQNGGVEGKDINPEILWNKLPENQKKEAVVAVVDSGIDYTHEDLKDNIWTNPYQGQLEGEHGFDFINGDGDPMDDNDHGTHCAGVIAAQTNNQKGIAGVNPAVELMALKILNAEGESSSAYGVAAYDYINKALNLGVPIVAVNNSWGTVDPSGEGSIIMKELIDLVGKKGAISVAAAGNDGKEVSEDVYPVGVNSPYLIKVAAVGEDNQLASYSSYSKEYVDLGAPGSNILSAVSKNTYTPALYGDQVKELSSSFADYEAESLEAVQWGVPKTSDEDEYTLSLSEEEYFGTVPGKSLKIEAKDMKKGEQVILKIPYTLEELEDKDNRPQVGMMVKGEAAESDQSNPSVLFVAEGADQDLADFDPSEWNEDWSGVYVDQGNSPWDQINLQSSARIGKKTQERAIFLCIEAGTRGDLTVYLDQLGISKENIDPDKLGKYAFKSGTSMAAPYVTGAAALLYSIDPTMAQEERVNTLLSMTQKEPSLEGKTATGGVLELSKEAFLVPKIYDASVQFAKKTLTIEGNGFAKDAEVTVNGQKAKILSQSQKKIVIQDQGWINRIVDITVQGSNGTAEKKGVYLVKGKKAFTLMKTGEADGEEDFEEVSLNGMGTDGSTFYGMDSLGEVLMQYTETDEWSGLVSLVDIDPAKLFGREYNNMSDGVVQEQFLFGKDLTFMDGKFYNIASIIKFAEPEMSMEDLEQLLNEENWDTNMELPAYSREYRLICMDPVKEKAQTVGEIPEVLKNTSGWTMSSYNGKLYVMGGYDYQKKSASKQVQVYDPKTKKWSAGPSLPESRAFGKAVQSQDRLIYTLGMGEGESCPKNLIFRNGKWSVSKAKFAPYNPSEITLSGKKQKYYDGSIGISAGGILYMGTPADGLGDTYTYSAAKDQFIASDFQMIGNSKARSFEGITVGSKIYGFDEIGNLYKGNVASGLVKVSALKRTGGYISGANKSYMPGSSVTLKAVPYTGYYVTSFKVDGKSVNGRIKTVRPTADMTAYAAFGKYVTKVKLSRNDVTLRAGTTWRLKASVSPSTAANKQVTYRSGNTKYATVSSSGIISAKRAGIGKTVTIQVKAKDGSGKSASCKVRIVR